MKELVTMSNDELAVSVNQVKRREHYMQTDDGKARAKMLMLEQFEYLRMSGYKLPNADPEKMSEVWAEQMRDYIVLYGSDVIAKAVKTFVMEDHREYRQAPNAAQIIEVAKRIGYNPIAESAKRQYEAEIEKADMEYRIEVEKRLTREKREELAEKYPNLKKVMELYGDK